MGKPLKATKSVATPVVAAITPRGPVDERAARVAAIAARHADAVDREARFPHEAVRALKDEALLGAMIPRAQGGEGLSLLDVAKVCGILGQACSATGMIFAMHQIKVSSLISHGIAAEWHRRFMARIAAEQLLLGSATTEAGIGGDLRNSICAVERDGGRFRLGKDATVISYGTEADAILATARSHPDAPSSDQVMVVLTRDQYTLRQISTWDTLGMRGTCSVGFRLEGEAGVEQILPKPFAEIAAQSMLAMSHLLWAALWQGIATGALARAQAYVRQEARRRPDVTPPGAERVAEGFVALQGLRATILAAIERFGRAAADSEELSSMGFAAAMNAVKLAASRTAVEVVQEALMVTGISGYRNDTPFSVARPLRDILSAPLMISNDRILGNTARLMLVSRLDPALDR